MPKVLIALSVSTAFAAQCNIEEAWSGQKQVVVPGCKGVGCNANGQDWDCAWCVFDINKCESAYKHVCKETKAARDAQSVSCGETPMKNIVELAEGIPALSTLVAAVVGGDLVDTLSSPGPFTVFAPTNDAFTALPAGVLDSLMKPANKAQLVDILTYHVISGATYSKDLKDGEKVATVEGKTVQFQVYHHPITGHADNLFVNNARIVTPDVMASNGVVHVVNGVLLPPSSLEAAKPNIVELAESVPALSTLVAAVVAGDLADTLSSAGPFTVFAPTNDAFAALPAGVVDSLMKPENKAQLVDILTYHVVPAQVLSKDLAPFQAVETVEGNKLHIQKWGGQVRVGPSLKSTDLKKVTAADNLASNGVAHIIDGVLLPPTAPTPPAPKAKNIVELAQSVPSLSTLVTAVVAGDLAATLSSPGPFTVFAPTNDGFGKLPKGTVDTLLKPENKATLVDILTYHVLPSQVLSTDLKSFQRVKTVEGKNLHVYRSRKHGVRVTPDGRHFNTVTQADNKASNGVVHIIDGVLSVPTNVPGGHEFAQCGGKEFKGLTKCNAGLVCVKQNDYYSQCMKPAETSQVLV